MDSSDTMASFYQQPQWHLSAIALSKAAEGSGNEIQRRLKAGNMQRKAIQQHETL